jgi:N-acetylglucosamine kinase-like BadF-type ATPase
MNFLLGIDVGGTKYHFRARPEKGRDVNVIVPSEGNLHELGAEGLVRVLHKNITSVKNRMRRGSKISGVSLGVSGLDRPRDIRSLTKHLMKRAWWRAADPEKRLLSNDIMIGLRAGTASVVAMGIISGTGSNGYAIDADGDEAWVSGRGHLMSDEGSGYSIAVAGLRATTMSEDGRGPTTRISEKLFKALNVQSTQELLPIVYAPKFTKGSIAELNRIVEEASAEGDNVAKKIHDDAADQLILMAKTLYNKLHFGSMKLDTVLIGGTINKNKELQKRFFHRARRHSWMNPIPLTDDPVEGALRVLGGL